MYAPADDVKPSSVASKNKVGPLAFILIAPAEIIVGCDEVVPLINVLPHPDWSYQIATVALVPAVTSVLKALVPTEEIAALKGVTAVEILESNENLPEVSGYTS